MSTGIACACLSINHRLSVISSARRSSVSPREKRISFWSDLAIGTLPPVFVMAIYYTRQANRYNISESFGCQPSTYYDVYALLAVSVPPIIIGLISFVYGGESAGVPFYEPALWGIDSLLLSFCMFAAIAVYNFTSRRLQFQTVLQQSGGGLNTSKFIRLVSLSSFEMLLSVPLSIYAMAWVVHNALEPIGSWQEVHADWYRIDTFDAAAQAVLSSAANTDFQRWVPVFAAFVYFVFFGTQEDSMATYERRIRQVGRFFKRPFGCRS